MHTLSAPVGDGSQIHTASGAIQSSISAKDNFSINICDSMVQNTWFASLKSNYHKLQEITKYTKYLEQ